jgi:malate dehydrogenase (oxaloacetate-decarboxylating)
MADSSVAPIKGHEILNDPLSNKGTAFSASERKHLGLLGLLPPQIEPLDEQVERAYQSFASKTTPIERHIFMRALQDTNEVLFYRLVTDHLDEMMPVIYTPVVGEACQKFSEIYRRPRGLFISYAERHLIYEMLGNAPCSDVKAIVVTDGERILGLGDQGAGGMGIPIGKLSLYTAAGGISPGNTLPILLDVGTNNKDRLSDPFYIGWRHERISGDAYFEFVDNFVQAVKKRWPDVLLQFEDFALPHAAPLLDKYRDQLCMFNDDIQGTAAVAVGTLIAASKVAGINMREHRVAFLGAGSAGAGIAEQTIRAMVRDGSSENEARSRIFMVDRYGLLHDGMTGLMPFQQRLTQPNDAVADWSDADGEISLASVIAHAKPTVLIGVSGQPGLFTEEIVRAMAQQSDRPIIFPMSNPTSRAEAKPEDIINWTEGRALVATGSPFAPVEYKGKTYAIAQSNNTYIFPGMGLGIIAGGATRVTDNMFMSAAEKLAEMTPAMSSSGASLLPDVAEIRAVSKSIAFAVAKQAREDGVAPKLTDEALHKKIGATVWDPAY